MLIAAERTLGVVESRLCGFITGAVAADDMDFVGSGGTNLRGCDLLRAERPGNASSRPGIFLILLSHSSTSGSVSATVYNFEVGGFWTTTVGTDMFRGTGRDTCSSWLVLAGDVVATVLTVEKELTGGTVESMGDTGNSGRSSSGVGSGTSTIRSSAIDSIGLTIVG